METGPGSRERETTMDDATTVELDRTIASLPLQDALRAIGYGLEASRVRRARLQLHAAGIVVETTGAYAVRAYSWDDLAVQVRVQRGLRQPGGPAADPWKLTRWSVLLRAAGQLLDRQHVTACRIEARVASASHESELRAIVDGRVVLETLAVQLHWLRLRARFDGREPHGLPSVRPWWRRWRYS
jgi:hypothetical protein